MQVVNADLKFIRHRKNKLKKKKNKDKMCEKWKGSKDSHYAWSGKNTWEDQKCAFFGDSFDFWKFYNLYSV